MVFLKWHPFTKRAFLDIDFREFGGVSVKDGDFEELLKRKIIERRETDGTVETFQFSKDFLASRMDELLCKEAEGGFSGHRDDGADTLDSRMTSFFMGLDGALRWVPEHARRALLEQYMKERYP